MDKDNKGYTFADKRGVKNESVQGKQDTKEEPRLNDQERNTSAEEFPKIDFPTLIMSFASAAMMSLGMVPDPMTGERTKNLDLAQQNIDIISLLQEKTKGNLSKEEDAMIEGVLYELRMSFVQVKKGII